jgi:hypothetical protein
VTTLSLQSGADARARERSVHSPSAIAALTDSLQSEERLLVELAGVIRRQRDAVATDDMDALDDAVFATHRVLVTLGEARRRRRSVTELLGEGDLNLEHLAQLFGGDPPAPIRDAAARLSVAARDLHRDIEINRRVLRESIDRGDRMIRALVGAPVAPPTYADRGTSHLGSIILNRTA